jgi:hypothetical protein
MSDITQFYQSLNLSHNMYYTQSYDSYWTGSNWNSSDSNANFRNNEKKMENFCLPAHVI